MLLMACLQEHQESLKRNTYHEERAPIGTKRQGSYIPDSLTQELRSIDEARRGEVFPLRLIFYITGKWLYFGKKPLTCGFLFFWYSTPTMSVRMKVTRAKTGARRAHHRAGSQALALDKETGLTYPRHFMNPETGEYRGKSMLKAKKKASVQVAKEEKKESTKKSTAKKAAAKVEKKEEK